MKKIIRKKGFLPIAETSIKKLQKEILATLHAHDTNVRGNLRVLVQDLLSRKHAFLDLAKKYPTPFYVFDKRALLDTVDAFTGAFNEQIPNFKAYYAMKVNHYPSIVKAVIQHGMGIDASSGREVAIALKLGACDILFTGPAKSRDELELAITHCQKVVVNLDSFRELRKLAALTSTRKTKMRAGVRVFTKEHGVWSKFGIPVEDLAQFWQEAQRYPYIDLQGIQFHSSFNESVLPYQKNIAIIAEHLRTHFSVKMLNSIKFFDFGGGFETQNAYGYFPWATPAGQIFQAVDEQYQRKSKFKDPYYITQAPSFHAYAQGVARAVKRYLAPLIQCAYYAEPGHVICDPAMHILLRVADKKRDNHVILDGGINMVGWEKYEDNYWPIINLTHPSVIKEIACTMYGNLCMTDDLWGYYCYAERIDEGDVILVPNQGAMSYSLAQNFIKAIPNVYKLQPQQY